MLIQLKKVELSREYTFKDQKVLTVAYQIHPVVMDDSGQGHVSPYGITTMTHFGQDVMDHETLALAIEDMAKNIRLQCDGKESKEFTETLKKEAKAHELKLRNAAASIAESSQRKKPKGAVVKRLLKK